MQQRGRRLFLTVVLSVAASAAMGAPLADDLIPQSPALFMPGGMLGVQLGRSWEESKHSPALKQLNCQAVAKVRQFDEVCFFRTASASRVAGAPIHDGFIARKGDRLVLVGTGISIAGAEDPLAEAVVQTLQSQINSAFQHTGDNVLFVKLPARHMSSDELEGYSQMAPVLLVQFEARTHELAVLYGYLAPVNAFGSLTAD